MPTDDYYSQMASRVRLGWGRYGARRAAERGDILVVVDVLSFSTAVTTAVERGVTIYPCSKDEDSDALAAQWEAVAAVHRRDVPAKGRFSLSPHSYFEAEPGTRVVLPSPNGATCSRYGRSVPRLFVGALINARAAARASATAMEETGAALTVLACGERWEEPNEDGELRFAIEDYLGAGAIFSYLPDSLTRSPEAALCEAAFQTAKDRLPEILRGSGSGIELIDRDCAHEVEHAAHLNLYDAVPQLQDGERLEKAR